MSTHTIHFPNTDYEPVTLQSDDTLSLCLTQQNSPILFGCRTGICGTCLVSATGKMAPPTADEQEVLALFAPDCATARLACQLKHQGALSLTPLKP
ncbi:MAG: 2Fe-2S iron-sulfur cluster-binding protein [Cyanobacteria bacterium J06627_28]